MSTNQEILDDLPLWPALRVPEGALLFDAAMEKARRDEREKILADNLRSSDILLARKLLLHLGFAMEPSTEYGADARVDRVAAIINEWVDVMLLAMDGAWRAGHEPEAIAQAIADKQSRNEQRQWPDWRTAEPGKAIEHIRDATADKEGCQ